MTRERVVAIDVYASPDEVNALPSEYDRAQTARIEGLWAVVSEAMERADLEGHLAALILQSGLRIPALAVVTAPWISDVQRILDSRATAAGPLRRAQDVATIGIRLALGRETERAPEYVEAARREVAREPLPPAACLRDDQRVLIGVAAGIGAASVRALAPTLARDVLPLLHAREHHGSLREVCLDLFAEALLGGSTALSAELAQRAFRHLTASAVSRPSATDRDRVTVFWLATRLLEANWRPTDYELSTLGSLIADSRRSTRLLLGQAQAIDALDAALLLDAMAACPSGQLARQSTIEAVLAIVDHFAASAEVLANRQRDRTALTIQDEYDVQDIFHALILPIVPDIVPEDPAPKIAGRSTRLDFTSKAMRLGIELKHVKSASHSAEVRKELLVDEGTYQEHPYVETVVAFVYDPRGYIAQNARTAFEADLSTTVTLGGRTVRYIVRVR
jgi:hypothetical protein